MAKANWIKTSKVSGTGNSTFTISADRNTGRNSRQSVVTVLNSSGSKPSKTITVTQNGEVYLSDLTWFPKQLPYQDDVLKITGKTNAKVMRVYTDKLVSDAYLTVNGVEYSSTENSFFNFVLPDTLGATATYDFSLELYHDVGNRTTETITIEVVSFNNTNLDIDVSKKFTIVKEGAPDLNLVATNPTNGKVSASGGTVRILLTSTGVLFTTQEPTNVFRLNTFTWDRESDLYLDNVGEYEYETDSSYTGTELKPISIYGTIPANTTGKSREISVLISAFDNRSMSGGMNRVTAKFVQDP